jgi:hypothetical protein
MQSVQLPGWIYTMRAVRYTAANVASWPVSDIHPAKLNGCSRGGAAVHCCEAMDRTRPIPVIQLL